VGVAQVCLQESMHIIQRAMLCEGRDHRSTLDFTTRAFEIDLNADVRWKRLYVDSNDQVLGLGAGRGNLPKF